MKNNLIYYLFITLSIIVNSCSEGVKDEYSIISIVLAEVTAITTPTTDTTPSYTFSSTESGAITYGGDCSSSTTSAISGNNPIILNSLSDGTYTDCTITVSKTTVSKTMTARKVETNLSGSLTMTSFTVVTLPIISEVTAVTTPTRDTTPDYTFSSSEAGTITYGGSCSSSTTSAISGNNTITFATTNDGWTYSDCTITVTDSLGNVSNTFAITSFTVDTSPGVFVGVGLGRIVRSTDNGSSFDNVTSPTNLRLTGVTFGNNTFVAVGYGGNIVRSTDNGTTFDNATSRTDQLLRGVTFGNNTFVAVGNSGITVRSTDNGTTWDNTTSRTDNHLRGVTFGNNTFVAVGHSGNIVRSTDNGTTFDNATSQTPNQIWGVGFGNNTFVAVGLDGLIARSTDNGSSFDNVTSGTDQDQFGVTFGNNTFVTGARGGRVYTSSDGNTWTQMTNPTAPGSSNLMGASFGNNTFVAVGANGSIVRSTDNGSSFSIATSPIGTGDQLDGVGF